MTWAQDRDSILRHYRPGVESERVAHRAALEYERTLDILARYLPPDARQIGDVGGGPGTYAIELAKAGATVSLIDPVAEHVEAAHATANSLGLEVHATAGDALTLPWEAESFDACLAFGPMYHLTAAEERARAWRELHRVVRPGGGVVFVTAISRLASTYSGLLRGHFLVDGYDLIVAADIATGQHRNESNIAGWFTTSFCHGIGELAAEGLKAGFRIRAEIAVDGPGICTPDLDWWLADLSRKSRLLDALRAVEQLPEALAASPQVMVVCERP